MCQMAMLALTGSKLKPLSERGTEGGWVGDWATAWGLAMLGSAPTPLAAQPTNAATGLCQLTD